MKKEMSKTHGNKIADSKYIELIQKFIKKKWHYYPSWDEFFLQNHLDQATFYRHLKEEDTTDKTPEQTLNYWYLKMKEFQKSFCFQGIGRKNSIKGLTWILEKVHKVGERKSEVVQVSEVDFAIRFLEHELNTFFTLARKPLIDFNKTFIIMEGGRAGGKSDNTGISVLLLVLKRIEPGIFICAREVQKSLQTSVKSLLERLIKKYKIEKLFKITREEIICRHNEVKIIFMGLKDGTADNTDTVKSTDTAFGIWVEEAQTVSLLSIEKLIPTTARNKSFKMFFTYNRQRHNTIVHDYFFNGDETRYGWEKTQHISINYYDNKFNTPELIAIAEMDKKINYAKWRYIWNGEPQSEFDGALWTYDAIKDLNLNIAYEKENYIRRIVATDPATSSKDFNNEYGIVVLGLTATGIVHLLADYSGHFTAIEYSKAIANAYFSYECEAVVYEENQGGEHIANTILSESKNIRLIPVRASQSKYLRALPVSNLCSQGRVYFIKSFPILENQMLLLTTQGYQGASGESPDRLDAFVWGVYDLLGLKDNNSINVYFKHAWFKIIDFDYKATNKIAYFSYKGSKTVFLRFDYFYLRDGIDFKQHILLKDIKVFDTNEADSEAQLSDATNIIAFDKDNIDLSKYNIPVNRIEIEKLSLAEYSSYAMPFIQRNMIYITKNIEQIIIDNVCQYEPETVKQNDILETILEIIYYEHEGGKK